MTTPCQEDAMLQASYDWGGWMWVIIDIVAVVILGAAIIAGTIMWGKRPRDAETRRKSEEATRELYHHRYH
jgi:hypothetical protein